MLLELFMGKGDMCELDLLQVEELGRSELMNSKLLIEQILVLVLDGHQVLDLLVVLATPLESLLVHPVGQVFLHLLGLGHPQAIALVARSVLNRIRSFPLLLALRFVYPDDIQHIIIIV